MPDALPHTCDLLIRGGTLVTESGTCVGNVAVLGETIVSIGQSTPAAIRTIDAEGMLVLPGCVDAHTHLNTNWPFHDERRPADDFESGTRAAAAGGITTVCDFVYPLGEESLHQAIARVTGVAATAAHVDVALHVAITTYCQPMLDELAGVVADGYPSFKFYTSLPDFKARTADYLQILAELGRPGGLAMFHCEDAAIVEYGRRILTGSDRTAPGFYPDPKPPEAELAATALALSLAAVANAPAYLVHLSCSAALEEALAARARGSRVFVETRPLYLHLTETCFKAKDDVAARYIGTPPPRSGRDRERLWSGLSSGQVDVVASDHVGFTLAQKYQPGDTFDSVPKGSASMETMLPMLYSEVVRQGRIHLEQCVQVLATNPARILALYPRKGTIAVGSDADLCVLDPQLSRVVSGQALHSAADFDVFEGREVVGWPVYTVARGDVIFELGEVRSRPGRGQLLSARRQPTGAKENSHVG